MHFRKPLFVALFLALPLLAHSEDTRTTPAEHGIAISSIDMSIRPGDDFYLYANGSWINRTTLPADRSSLGVFNLLVDRSNKRVAAIIEDAAKSNAAPNTDNRRIADLYHSYMDEAAIESHGLTSIKPLLDEIAAIHTQKELAHALGLSIRADVDALNNTNFHTANIFGLWVAPGFNDPDHYAAYLLQGGIQLPNRDYYLTDSPHMKEIRAKVPRPHRQHVSSSPASPTARSRAERVLALETRHRRETTLPRRQSKTSTRPTMSGPPPTSPSKAPGLDWPEFFKAAGLDKQQSFIVWQPTAFTGESALVKSESIEAWKDLLAFHLLESYAAAAPQGHLRRTLRLHRHHAPRRHRSSAHATSAASPSSTASSATPSARSTPSNTSAPKPRPRSKSLVANLNAAFRSRLESLTWMAPATKKEAIAKLDTLQVSVGYPDHWRTYAGYEVKPDDLFGNVWRSDLFEYHYDINRIGTPTDRKEWTMEPQTVNAVNLPLHNALNFPAAILEPPFFDPKAPDAANYGAIGTVIGHEISHTFDSEGAAFDARGRVRNWWTPEDFAHFKTATDALAAQYDTYSPFPDVHRQRPPDPRRKHRRRSRRLRRLRRLPRLTQRPARTRRRQPHRRPAVLHRLRTELGLQGPRQHPPPAGPHRPALTRHVPRRHRPQHRRLVHRLQNRNPPTSSTSPPTAASASSS